MATLSPEQTAEEILHHELKELAGLSTVFFFNFDATKERPQEPEKSAFASERDGEAYHIFTDERGSFALFCLYWYKNFTGDLLVVALIPVDLQKTAKLSKKEIYGALTVRAADEDKNTSPADIAIAYRAFPVQAGEILHPNGNIDEQLNLIKRAKDAMRQKPLQPDYLKQGDHSQLLS